MPEVCEIVSVGQDLDEKAKEGKCTQAVRDPDLDVVAVLEPLGGLESSSDTRRSTGDDDRSCWQSRALRKERDNAE